MPRLAYIKKVFLYLKHIIYDFGFQKISIGKFMLILNLFIICQAAINDTLTAMNVYNLTDVLIHEVVG